MSNWLYILLIIIAVYVGISILLYYFQEQLLFKPEKLPKDFEFFYKNQKTEEYNLSTRDGAVIHGLHFMRQILQHHSLKSTKYLSKWIEEKKRRSSHN